MANIDNGFSVGVLSLDDLALIVSRVEDPTVVPGYEAPVGSLYLRTNGLIYRKTGAANVDWIALDTSEVDNLEAAIGLAVNANGEFVPSAFSSATSIVSPTSLTNALLQLDSAVATKALSRHNGTISQTFSTTPTTLLLNTSVRMDTEYTYNSGVVTFTVGGTYRISFDASYATTVSQLTSCNTTLYKNGVPIAGATSYSYHNSSTNGVQTTSGTISATFATNDTLEVVGVRNSGSGSLVSQANGCRLNIVRLT